MMNNSLQGLKKFSIRVGKHLVKFSKRGVSVKPRFRLMFVDESRLHTVWSMKGNRSRFLFVAIVLFFVVTFIGAAIIGVTPLRSLLPGYLKRSQRYEIVDMSSRLDSIAHVAAINSMYLDNMVAILNDEIDLDSIQKLYNDSISRLQLPVDSLLATSREEREFVQRYQKQERFNVSVLSPVAAEGMVFYPPVASSVARSLDTSGRMTLQLHPSTPVSAIYRGTVIDCQYIPGQGYTIIIQHPNNFISCYAGLSTAMVQAGDKINAGTRIGLSSENKSSMKVPLTFEMWHNGSRLDPATYIDFEHA